MDGNQREEAEGERRKGGDGAFCTAFRRLTGRRLEARRIRVAGVRWGRVLPNHLPGTVIGQSRYFWVWLGFGIVRLRPSRQSCATAVRRYEVYSPKLVSTAKEKGS